MYGVKAAVLSGYGQDIELKTLTPLGPNSDKRHAGLTQWYMTAEMARNDTKMGWKCEGNREKRKYNYYSILTATWPPPQYAKWKVLKFRLGTSVTPLTKKASKMTVLSDF